MAITLWVNADGSYSDPTYTLGGTEYAESITTLSTAGSTTIETPGGDWGSRSVFDINNNFAGNINGTSLSGEFPTTAGRVLILAEHVDNADTEDLLNVTAATAGNGTLRADVTNSTTVTLEFNYDAFNEIYNATITIPTQPDPYCLEIIYDAANATASQRLRGRAWAIGGSPGSFTNCTTTFGGSSGTTDAFTSFRCGFDSNDSGYYIGQIVVDDDTAEDLSSYEDTNDYPSGASSGVGKLINGGLVRAG